MGSCNVKNKKQKIKTIHNKEGIKFEDNAFLISTSLFYKHFIKDLQKNKSNDSNSLQNYINLSKQNIPKLLKTIWFDEEAIIKIEEENLRNIYNFQEIFIITNDSENNGLLLDEGTSTKLETLNKIFKQKKVSISSTLILNSKISNFLKEFEHINSLHNDKENLINYSFPIIAFSSNDIFPRNFQKRTKIFMQKHNDFNSNLEINENFYKEILDINEIMFLTNKSQLKKTQDIKITNIDENSDFFEILNIISKIFSNSKNGINFLIVHYNNKEDFLKAVNLVTTFLTKKLKIDSSSVENYIENIFSKIKSRK